MLLAGAFEYIYFISVDKIISSALYMLKSFSSPLFSLEGDLESAAAGFSCSLWSSMRRRFLCCTGFRDGSSIAGYDQFLAPFSLI